MNDEEPIGIRFGGVFKAPCWSCGSMAETRIHNNKDSDVIPVCVKCLDGLSLAILTMQGIRSNPAATLT